MSIAAYNLDELVFTLDQSLIVDPTRIHLAESVLTALSDETAPVVSVPIVKLLFVVVADRCAVDNYAGALDGFLSFIGRGHAHLGEFLSPFFIDAKFRASIAQDHDLRTVGEKRRPLVKSYFIYTELLLEGAENSDQGFADSSGADHMNDFFLCHLSSRRALMERILSHTGGTINQVVQAAF